MTSASPVARPKPALIDSQCAQERMPSPVQPSALSNSAALLASFDGSDGKLPGGDLIADAAGNLFGVTPNGGAFGGTGFTSSEATGRFDLSVDGAEISGALADESLTDARVTKARVVTELLEKPARI